MAKPRQYKKEHFIEAIKGSGGFKTTVAKRLGCSYTLVQIRLKEDPELQALLDEEFEVQLDNAETVLQELINEKTPSAVYFYLKTRGKHRGYVERQEISGPDKEPLSFKWTEE